MTSNFLHFCAQHPFLLLPCSVFAMLLILYLGKKRFPKASKLALLLPVWGVINLIYAGDWNAEYVYNHGVKGEGVVVRLEPTDTWINEVQVVNYHCLIKTKSGKQWRPILKTTVMRFIRQMSWKKRITVVFKIGLHC